MTDAILILAGGVSQIPLVRALKSLGATLVIVDRDAAAPCRSLGDDFIHESVEEPGAILAKLREARRRFRFLAVWTQSSGPASVTQTVLARELGVAHFSTQLSRLALDKEAFGEFLREHGFTAPRPLRGFRNPRDLPYPVVVRPAVTAVGKRMIFQVNDPAGLASAVDRSLQASRNHCAHITEYVPGEDVILIGIRGRDAMEGIAVVREHNLFRAGRVINLGYELVRDESRYPVASMLAEAARLFDLTGDGRGVFLASFRCSAQRSNWIELHLDFGGDFLFEKLLSNAFGQDSLAWTCRRLLWPVADPRPAFQRASLIYTLVRRDAERLAQISPLLEGTECELLLETRPLPVTSLDRIGAVSITATDEAGCRGTASRLDAFLGRSAETFPPLSDELLAA